MKMILPGLTVHGNSYEILEPPSSCSPHGTMTRSDSLHEAMDCLNQLIQNIILFFFAAARPLQLGGDHHPRERRQSVQIIVEIPGQTFSHLLGMLRLYTFTVPVRHHVICVQEAPPPTALSNAPTSFLCARGRWGSDH